MSKAGSYFKTAMSLVTTLEEGKPHSSVTDWIEVLSSDRYEELSLDGISELVDSVNILGPQGTTEASRAIRKKLKYGNVHRQIRALVVLRALTENAGKGFQLNWANEQLMERLRLMATDQLLDPKVKKMLLMVFHSWSLHYKDEPRMHEVAGLYRKYTGHGTKPVARKVSSITSSTTATAKQGTFDNDIFSHDWNPAPGNRGADTYTDLAAAKAEAEERKRAREARIALEQREAEVERRERELRRKRDMAEIEERRRKAAAEEAENRRKLKEQGKKKNQQPKRPPFNFEKEKPQIMVAVANAIQCANNLVNACRLVNREVENVTESPKVQDNLDKAKVARRSIIKYIQLVTDEEYVGTLLDANERIVEAIQLYDRLSKPAVLDSDSEDDAPDASTLHKRLAAQKLEADRTGELQKIQENQKRESARRQQRQLLRQASEVGKPVRSAPQQPSSVYSDLQDLDFGSIAHTQANLPPPMRPDSGDDDSYGGSLSDFSDYDSSDAEWQAAHGSGTVANKKASTVGPSSHVTREYASLEDDFIGKSGLLAKEDDNPFGDPFADELDTPVQEKQRLQWAEI
ncbi:hypothetical protein D1P53_004533 [Cryptococcus gattii VGV]|nr:hypothetical protein D1P53_004533 [Cryptococcus gattii VGV]